MRLESGAEIRTTMPLVNRIGTITRRVLLGQADVPHACDLEMLDPQDEVAVWLHGMAAPRDVTSRHSVACAAPFMVCIGFEREENLDEKVTRRLSLLFCERSGQRRVLGQIGLRLSSTIQTKGPDLYIFEARSCSNFCVPWAHRWAHHLYHSLYDSYKRWRSKKVPNVRMSFRGARCNSVMFICPRPLDLVSLVDGECGNIFPMNLMGPVANGYIVFALKSTTEVVPLVERVGQIALSNIPLEQSMSARDLGKNHRRAAIDWDQLPFETRRSALLGIPVPDFAVRVRELEIQTVRRLGSHTLFVARVVGEERRAVAPVFFMIHGFYDSWRRQHTARA